MTSSRAAGLAPAEAAALPSDEPFGEAATFTQNRAWELDRAQMLERSERRAWAVAVTGAVLGLVGIAAVFAQGPLRRVVEIPIVVDRVTGEATIQQRLSVETVPLLEALDKHNLATFVRAREGYSWNFLQRDYDQVARMAVPAVFADYSRLFEGEAALHKKLAAHEEWRINVVGVRLPATGRKGNEGEATVTYDKQVTGRKGNEGEATVTYDKQVRQTDRAQPDLTTRHVATIVYQYQPKVLAKEADRLENPFGFVVAAYRSDPEITTPATGGKP